MLDVSLIGIGSVVGASTGVAVIVVANAETPLMKIGEAAHLPYMYAVEHEHEADRPSRLGVIIFCPSSSNELSRSTIKLFHKQLAPDSCI
jgi:hypothetical protein